MIPCGRSGSISIETDRQGKSVNIVISLCLITGLILAGCSTRVHVTKVGPQLEPTNPEDIRVYDIGAELDMDYQIIGKVYAFLSRSGVQKINRNTFLEILKPAAAEMGADAIIGFYFRKPLAEETNKKYGSGLAVRFLGHGSGYAINSEDFIVAIPPIIMAEKFEDEKENEKRDGWVREAAQLYLEEKGYYAEPVDVDHIVDAKYLHSLTDEEFNRLFGKQTGHILITELIGFGGPNVGLVTSKQASIKASLFSREKRTVVWENTGKGRSTTLGIFQNINRAILGGHEKEPIKRALEAMIENLKPADMKDSSFDEYIVEKEKEKEIEEQKQKEQEWDDL